MTMAGRRKFDLSGDLAGTRATVAANGPEERMSHTNRPAVAPLTAALAREEAAWAREHLERDVVAWLTTVAPDGRVQSSVISFLYDGDGVFFYSQPGTP